MKKGPDPRILDDIARVAGGAVNIVSGLQQQLRDDLRSRVDDMASRMDLVPRDDLDRAVTLIGTLRARVEEMEARLDELESRKGADPVKAAKAPAKPKAKTAAKKKAVTKKKGRKA